MNTEFQYDVFLSYNRLDKPRVRRLAERLGEAGLRLWFDEWKLPVAAARQSAAFSVKGPAREEKDGGALPRRRYDLAIERGLETSRTPNIPQPSTMHHQPIKRLERSTVGRGKLPFRDPANAGRRFIPLLRADPL